MKIEWIESHATAGERIEAVISSLEGAEATLDDLDTELMVAIKGGHLPLIEKLMVEFFSDSTVITQAASEAENEALQLDAQELRRAV